MGSDANDAAAFYAAGDRDVADILDFAGRDLERGRALDVGCGPGRHLGALSREFAAVDGVDIAPEMLDVAQAIGLPANVRLAPTSGVELPFPDTSFDFVMSLLVFQHIPDDRILLANLREMRRVMNAKGRAVLQFDSRTPQLAVRLIQALPDAWLPPVRRRYVRRYRRAPEVIAAMLAKAGLLVVRDSGAGSASHFVVASGNA